MRDFSYEMFNEVTERFLMVVTDYFSKRGTFIKENEKLYGSFESKFYDKATYKMKMDYTGYDKWKFKPLVSVDLRSKPLYSGKFSFDLLFDNQNTTIADAKNITALFIELLHSMEIDIFVRLKQGYLKEYEAIITSLSGTQGLIPTGKNSLKVLEISQDSRFSKYFKNGGNVFRFRNVSHHFIHFLTNREELAFEIYSHDTTLPNLRKTLSSMEEIIQLHDELTRDNLLMNEKKNEILSIVQRYAPNAFHDEQHLRLFENRYPFSFAKEYKKGKIRYIARMPVGNRVNKDLSKLMQKVQTEMESFMKKHRVKAVVAGKTNDNIPHLFNKIYNYIPDLHNYDHIVTSSFTKEQLNHHLKSFISTAEKEVLEKEYIDWFTMFLRMKNKRNRPKFGYKLGDLYLFHSSTQLFIYKKEDIFDIDLEKHPWKTKKDKEKLNELLSWKMNVV